MMALNSSKADAMTALKPCPFCGSEIPTPPVYNGTTAVCCPNCQVRTRAYAPDEAARRWNERAAPAIPAEVQSTALKFINAVDQEQMRRHDGMMDWRTQYQLFTASMDAMKRFRDALRKAGVAL